MNARAAPLPVLTTLVLERRERGYLAWVAVAGEIAELPLESPPIDASPHALEIRVEGSATPLVVLAEPMGGPTGSGYPLRLRPLDDEQETTLRAELFAGEQNATSTENRRITLAPPSSGSDDVIETLPPPRELTEEHVAALAKGTGASVSERPPGWLKGQTLGDGRFVLEELIGGGASGEVYRAVHAILRRRVAVKVLHPSLQQSQDYCTRFYGEALAASRLDHRNVLRVIDYGQEPNGMLYIVMELLEGKSLQHILDAEGRLPETRIVELVAQACAGLAHAHDAGVVHRDIKPENIVVVRSRDDDGRETDLVKVCDFGIAHWTRPVTDADGIPVGTPDSSKVVGTPSYMAPEQIQNEAVDARTDVYALGVILYELATGRLPFDADDAMAILRSHMVEEPAPPSVHLPELSPRLERVILKALEKEPERRQKDTRVLRAELRKLVDDDWASHSGFHHKVTVTTPLTADAFVKTTAHAVGTLRAIDEHARPASYEALGEALKGALIDGRLRLARDLVAWLKSRLADSTLASAETALSQRAMNILRDPEVARAHAMNILDGKVDRTEDSLELLREGGSLSAGTVVEARRDRSPSLELRAHFVAMLRAIGAPSLSVIVSALEPLIGLPTRSDEAFAEDLLRAVPDVRSDTAGEVTVRFVRLDKPPAVGAAALLATTRLWGARATPLLVGVLDASSDELRTTALQELEKLGAIDAVVIDRLGRIVAMTDAGADLKRAAAAAFAAATPEARPRAIALLTSRLAPAQSLVTSIRSASGGRGPREDTNVVAELARSLHKLDPGGARAVLDRLVVARPELKPSVDEIFATSSE